MLSFPSFCKFMRERRFREVFDRQKLTASTALACVRTWAVTSRERQKPGEVYFSPVDMNTHDGRSSIDENTFLSVTWSAYFWSAFVRSDEAIVLMKCNETRGLTLACVHVIRILILWISCIESIVFLQQKIRNSRHSRLFRRQIQFAIHR